jgi:hypothetical protein
MSFSQHTRETINGWGSVFRFITPVLVTISIFVLAGLKDEIKDVRTATKELAKETQLYFTNHLSHHTKMEISFCERLVALETELKRLKK